MLYFVVNPSASSGKGLKIWKETETILKERKVSYECIMLRGPGDAGNAAYDLSVYHRPCTIALLGGDGTINEFISGLTTFEGIRFAYIPTGSGNDFARGMQLPPDPKTALELILSGDHSRLINIGKTKSEKKTGYFAVSSGIGFDAAACYGAAQSPLKKTLNRFGLGKLIYGITALRLLLTIRPAAVQITLDSGKQFSYRRVYFVTAMNVPYEGGGFMFCPQADPTDDRLDMIIAEGIPKWKVLTAMPLAMKGKHVNVKGIHILKFKRASITAAVPQYVHTDGEAFDYTGDISWRVLPDKLELVAP